MTDIELSYCKNKKVFLDTVYKQNSVALFVLLILQQLKTSVQEQHKLTYAVYAPHNAIRFPTSNHITYVKMVEIGAKLRELQMSSYDISNMSYFRIFCQLKIYARKTARETYAVFDFYHCDS